MKRFVEPPLVGWSGISRDCFKEYDDNFLDVRISGESFEDYSLLKAVEFFLCKGDGEWEMNVFDEISVCGEKYGNGRIEIMNDDRLSFWLQIDIKELLKQCSFVRSVQLLCKNDKYFFCVLSVNSVEGSRRAYEIYEGYNS